MGKVLNFKSQVGNLNFGKTIGGLKSHDVSVPLDSFWSYIFVFFCIFRGERHKSGAYWGVLGTLTE